MQVGPLALVCLLLPVAGALSLSLLRLPKRLQGMVGAGSVLLAFVAALLVALIHGVGRAPGARPVNDVFGTWVAAGGLHVPLGLWVDGLSTVFALVITGVGFLIHVYSLSYMAAEDEAAYGRYFAGMNLFVAAMLLLVLADSYPLMLIGWAGVGFASYLLIGFWYQRPEAVAAARKAFVLNAVGDAAFVLAIAVLALAVGHVGFRGLFLQGGARALGRMPSAAMGVGLLLFVAAAAKSAQFPLQSWLADAMEGPTPVSALIHAATMVTAGVYLIARSSALFAAAPGAAATAGDLGAVTALLAAGAAVAAYDLKRVLAYSTMSQVGYMVAGVSFGAIAAGVSHVVMHAFFKALLFMAAGMVMHATADERDMRRYGGLAEVLPLARWAFLVGALALAGIVPFAGFWSKDAIMGALLTRAPFAYVLLAAAAVLTPFYIFRAYYLTFAGRYRGKGKPHGAIPASMAWPTWVLAVLAVVGGAFALGLQARWGTSFDVLSAVISTVLALIGWGAAWALYHERGIAADRWAEAGWAAFLRREYGWEGLWQALLVRPSHALARWMRDLWEGDALPELPQAVVAAARGLQRGLSAWQSGAVRLYAVSMFWGLALLLAYALVRR
jgi:NADH-quinone oxidoreductase subunit L